MDIKTPIISSVGYSFLYDVSIDHAVSQRTYMDLGHHPSDFSHPKGKDNEME